jgi:acyl-CoA thioesterase FadM
MKEERIRFESYDLEPSGVVRASSILRRMQQLARDDLNSLGVSYEGMREKNMAFVVFRSALYFDRPVPGERDLVLQTAAGQTKGATFPRSFVLRDESGVYMKAMTHWVLLDFEKRSLLRPSALGTEIPFFEDLTDGLGCARLSHPGSREADFQDIRKVYASLLDQNNHLNNCNYADLATDLIYDLPGQIQEIQITYQHEARLGDTLSLKGYHQDDGVLICGEFCDRDEICFQCLIKKF